jgi:hypothetical protein
LSFTVQLNPPELIVQLGGSDRLFCGRRQIRIARDHVRTARVTDRRELERRLDHRVAGFGPHRDTRSRRVGTFLGRDVGGRHQFWAVRRDSDEVVVVDLEGSRWVRLVLDADLVDDEARRLLGLDVAR